MKVFFYTTTSVVFSIFALYAYLQGMDWYMLPVVGVVGTASSAALLLLIILSIFLPGFIVRWVLIGIVKVVARFYPKAETILELFKC